MVHAEAGLTVLENPISPALPISSAKAPPALPVIYSSDELLKGRREVWIEHGDQMYRLRVTSAKKLYLTK